MIITIFNDCKDTNALSRQNTRYAALFPSAQVSTFGISRDIEAAGCIVDILDAGLEKPQIIVGNIAPRKDKKYKNGCPFSYAQVGNTTIIGTKTIFSLLKKLNIIDEIRETDVYTVCKKFLDEDQAKTISNSQFRSFEYLPRLAKWINDGENIPAKKIRLTDSKKNHIWFVDNFGNCKTTAIKKSELANNFSKLPYYKRLADVPFKILSLTQGSSGYSDKRFIEIVLQGENAAEKHGLKIGDSV